MESRQVTVYGRTYSVSDAGEIYTAAGRELRQHTDRYGYAYIRQRYDGKRPHVYVHRLVAMCYIDNPDNMPQINHIDGNKQNNAAKNLEWATNSTNQLHSRYVLGNQTGYPDAPVVCVETGEQFRSRKAAERATGTNSSHIGECIKGTRKSAGGYHWTRSEEKGC